MKRTFSVFLFSLIATVALFALPISAYAEEGDLSATDAKPAASISLIASSGDAVTYPEGSIDLGDELAMWDFNTGPENTQIYNYKANGTTTKTHGGVSFDLATKTLTLDSVPGDKNAFFLRISDMGAINVKLVGTSKLCFIHAENTDLSFIGDGTLMLNPPYSWTRYELNWETGQMETKHYNDQYIFNEPLKGHNCELTIADTVTITFDGESADDTSIVLKYDEKTEIAKAFDCDAIPSKPLNWEYNEINNSYDAIKRMDFPLFRTEFPATKLMRLEGDTGASNYWIICNGGTNSSYTINRLVEDGGIWYQAAASASNTYYCIDGKYYHCVLNDPEHPEWGGTPESSPTNAQFTYYTEAEIATMPATLVSGNIATACIEGSWLVDEIYKKDGKEYFLNIETALTSYFAYDAEGGLITLYENGVNNRSLEAITPPPATKKGYALTLYEVSPGIGDGYILDYVGDTGLFLDADEAKADVNAYGTFLASGDTWLAQNGYEKIVIHHDKPMTYCYSLPMNKFSLDAAKPQVKPTITVSNKTVAMGKTANLNAKVDSGGALTYKSSNTKIAKVSSKGVVTPVKVGTVAITIKAAAKGIYKEGSKSVTVKVNQGTQSMTFKAQNKSVKYSKLKKAARSVAITKAKAKTAVTYSITKAVNGKKNVKSKFSINKSTGKITVKKGTAKGTYKVTVKAAAKKTTNWKAANKSAAITIKVS